MKIHHLRSATCVIESDPYVILVDPMLGAKGSLPPFSFFRHRPRRNPTVPLPESAQNILGRVTHCLITHCRTFGIKAFQHTDHLDGPGETFLRERRIPVACPEKDAAYLGRYGIPVAWALPPFESVPFINGTITAVPAQHGHGRIRHLMANGAGFILRLANEPSVYISGDTVFTDAVRQALTDMKPDIAVVAAGCAALDVGGPILMSLEEVAAFVCAAPGKVIANHLEALNHCGVSRAELKRALLAREHLPGSGDDLMSRTWIPEDGEVMEF